MTIMVLNTVLLFAVLFYVYPLKFLARAFVAINYAGHYLAFGLVGLISTATAMAGIGMRFGFPGLVFGLIGPFLTGYWRWRTKRDATAGVIAQGA